MALNLNTSGFKSLNIETFGDCNMNCQFCCWDRREDKKAKLADDVVYRLIDEATAEGSGCEAINFSQFNEPLLDRRLMDFIAYAKSKGMKVILVSNGVQFGNANILEKFLASPPDELTLSVQTLDVDTFGKVRGINLDYERYATIIYKFLSAARGTDMQVTIDMACNFLTLKKAFIRKLLGFNTGDESVPMSTGDVLPNVERFLKGLEKHDPAFVFNENIFRRFTENIQSTYGDQAEYTLADNINLKIKRFMYGQRLFEFKPTSERFACTHPIVAVLAGGDVVPCCHMTAPLTSLGNVNAGSLEDALRSSADLISGIRSKDGEKPDVCRRCFGERTRRAMWLSKLRKMIGRDFGFHPLRYE